MVVRMRLIAIFLLVSLLLSGVGLGQTFAQSLGGKYFVETGHWVTGEFWAFYSSTPNALQLYGYPLTEVFIDEAKGNSVQYFQKARFELYPDLPIGQRVKLADLGYFLRDTGQPVMMDETSPACRTAPNTNFKICYAFRDFYDANGGFAQFGNALSNLMRMDDGLMVQYFDKARFEWRPERSSGSYVVLTDLGYQYFYVHGEDPSLLIPVDSGEGIVEGILNLQVRAYAKSAVTKASGEQTIYIVVQDQRLMPVKGAEIVLYTRMPSGEIKEIPVSLKTNEQGISQEKFTFDSTTVGIAEVVVVVRQKELGLQARTITSFRIWW
jgi:hypothetical protein